MLDLHGGKNESGKKFAAPRKGPFQLQLHVTCNQLY